MSKFGGIIASAMAGAAAGAGQGLATGAKMDYEAELQRQRDEALAKRDERLLALTQKFQADQGQLTREHASTEGALTRGQATELADKGHAVQYAQMAQNKDLTEKQLAEQGRHNRRAEDLTATGQSKIHIGEDGNVNLVGSDGKFKPVVDANGTVLKSEKDMSAKDQSKVRVLTALIKEEHDVLEKNQFMKDDQRAIVNARIDRFTKQIGSLLGMDTGVNAPLRPGAAGGSKPWERKWSAN